MIRVKIVQEHDKYKIGQAYNLTKNEAFGLIDSGVAILSKDITAKETVIKSEATILSSMPKKVRRLRK